MTDSVLQSSFFSCVREYNNIFNNLKEYQKPSRVTRSTTKYIYRLVLKNTYSSICIERRIMRYIDDLSVG